MFGADLVVNESAFHTGSILLLKVNFVTSVLLYSMYDLCSEFLVMSDLVGATTTTKKSNFKSSISLIILYIWIKSSLNLLQFKENKSSFQKFSPVIETMGTKTEEEKHIYDLIC